MRVSEETTAALSQDTGTYQARKKVMNKAGKGRTNLTYYMTLATHGRFKQYALENNTSMQQVINQALDEYFAARGEPPIEKITPIEKTGDSDE